MTIQPQAISEQEHRAIICICILAAFADGAQDETERTQIERILKGFSEPGVDISAAYQDVLLAKQPLSSLVNQVQSPAAKALAYEMAVCVCNADGAVNAAEQKFLADLRSGLQLTNGNADAHYQSAQTIAAQPFVAPPPVIDSKRDADIDSTIVNTAILNGALELMPHSLANMAIIPLQMRMVYQIGNRYGYTLDRGHIKELLGTVGVGMTSQVVEGYAQRLLGDLTRHVAGGFIGGLVAEATGSAVGFATTYAIGQVARKYYASGRTLSGAQLRDVFGNMLQQGRSLQGSYAGQIAQRARSVNVADLAPLVRAI